MDAFYELLSEGSYQSSEFARGPWDPKMQHGGPPAALLARHLQDVEATAGQALSRITFEILRPIPLGAVTVKAKVERGGKRVSMASAVMTDHLGQELVLARGWRMLTTPAEYSATYPQAAPALLADSHGTDWLGDEGVTSFHTGVEIRFAKGGFSTPGPATAWFRMRHPLVLGTEHRAKDTLFVAADCCNGIGSELDFTTSIYINTDLSVGLEREPVGEWICLDARTHVVPMGTTHAMGTLYDEKGRVAKSAQSLLVINR